MFSLKFLKNDESDSSESSENEDDSENEDENISLNDLQTLFSLLIADKVRGEQIVVEKITDYVDRVIPNVIFKEHFRLYPTTFEMILSLIGPALSATGITIGRKPISAEKQLYIALWFMATPDSYRYVKLCSILV
ncbi:Nuclease harbi1 isoform x2 [Camponotus japonicus]